MRIDELDLSYQELCRNALVEEQTRSLAATENWKHVDRSQVHGDWDALYREISGLIDTSGPADSEVQMLVKRHYDIACRFFTPSKDAYVGMALFYHENPAMKDFHNGYHPRMVQFLGDAICGYTRNVL